MRNCLHKICYEKLPYYDTSWDLHNLKIAIININCVILLFLTIVGLMSNTTNRPPLANIDANITAGTRRSKRPLLVAQNLHNKQLRLTYRTMSYQQLQILTSSIAVLIVGQSTTNTPFTHKDCTAFSSSLTHPNGTCQRDLLNLA